MKAIPPLGFLHDSALYRIGFDDWPSEVFLCFWNGRSAYRITMRAVLAFEYEVDNVGEFALSAVDSHNVDIRVDDSCADWSRRIARTGFVSDRYDSVYHVTVSSVMLRIERYSDTSVGISAFCRSFDVAVLEGTADVPEWLVKYGL